MQPIANGGIPTHATPLHSNTAARSTDYLMGYRRGLMMGRRLGPSGPEDEISDEQRPYYEEEVRLHTTELRGRPDNEKFPLVRRTVPNT
jgi:hypothetical protein